MARLRAPGGCPWDREQSFDSIRKYTLEETYEVFDAIERRDWPHLAEELGDLLLQVLFYAEMAANEGHFTIADVLDHLNRKLIRRHPHVFGDEASRAAGNRAERGCGGRGFFGGGAAQLGRDQSRGERRRSSAARLRRRSILGRGSIPFSGRCPPWPRRPSWERRHRKSGFDWPNWRDLLPKLAEETAELEAEAASGDPARKRPSRRNWATCCLPSSIWAATWAWMRRWRCAAAICASAQRFREMELASARPLEELAPDELEALWAEAKRKLAGKSPARERGQP